eukprot:s935_g25.t1
MRAVRVLRKNMAEGTFCRGWDPRCGNRAATMQKIVVFIPLVACLGLKLDVRTSDEPSECKGKLVASKKLCSEVDPETNKKCEDRFVEVSAGQYMQCVWESDECLTASGLNEYCKKPSGPQPTRDGMFAWFKSEDASTSSWVSEWSAFGVMEIITYNRQLTKKEIQATIEYLKWKLENGTQ